MRLGFWLAAAVWSAVSTPPGLADDCAAPCFAYVFTGELSDDWNFSTDVEGEATNAFEPSLDIELIAVPFDRLKLVGLIKTESVGDPEDGPPTLSIGTYVSELYGEVDGGSAVLRLGKFDPLFGLATDALSGIHATDLIDDYTAEERWAGEAAVAFDALGLSHRLIGSVFTTDRTVLSESLFTNRGRLSLDDGGAGNTTGLSSFALALDGCAGAEPANCYEEGDYGYRLGVRHQKAGEGGDGNELGFLGDVFAGTELNGMTLRLLGEGAYFRNYDGCADDAWFATVAAELESGAMTYAAAYSRQWNMGDENSSAQLLDLTAIYRPDDAVSLFGESWSLAGGYSFSHSEDGENTHRLSAKLTIEFGGHTGGGAVEDDELAQ